VVKLGRLVRGIDDMLRRALGEGIEVETIIAGGLWNTLVDTAQVENALLNLTINSRDAMDGHGRLTIEAGNASLDDAYAARHSEVTAGQYVLLAVTDTGCGIPVDVIDRVFEPFFTTKPEGRGTGLGLSMVYGFVKQSGGHIKIYSEPGQGTTVRIYLPRVRQQEDVETNVETGPTTGGTETVLVVEDDSAIRQSTPAMLEMIGHSVSQATEANEALELLDQLPFDVLVTDLSLPGIPGNELALVALKRRPKLRIVFASGYEAMPKSGERGALAEAIFLQKPYDARALAAAITSALGPVGVG
jgi:CheY-like chemotaxis protein